MELNSADLIAHGKVKFWESHGILPAYQRWVYKKLFHDHFRVGEVIHPQIKIQAHTANGVAVSGLILFNDDEAENIAQNLQALPIVEESVASPFVDLPSTCIDVWTLLLTKYLTGKQLVLLRRVCKRWNTSITSHAELWKHIHLSENATRFLSLMPLSILHLIRRLRLPTNGAVELTDLALERCPNLEELHSVLVDANTLSKPLKMKSLRVLTGQVTFKTRQIKENQPPQPTVFCFNSVFPALEDLAFSHCPFMDNAPVIESASLRRMWMPWLRFDKTILRCPNLQHVYSPGNEGKKIKNTETGHEIEIQNRTFFVFGGRTNSICDLPPILEAATKADLYAGIKKTFPTAKAIIDLNWGCVWTDDGKFTEPILVYNQSPEFFSSYQALSSRFRILQEVFPDSVHVI